MQLSYHLQLKTFYHVIKSIRDFMQRPPPADSKKRKFLYYQVKWDTDLHRPDCHANSLANQTGQLCKRERCGQARRDESVS